MRAPSPPECRLDLAPPLADQFIFGVAPIDYGPVLLLMPFGFHLTMNTLPSEGLLLRPTTSLPPSLDMAPLIRAPEGLQPSRTTRCSAHTTSESDFHRRFCLPQVGPFGWHTRSAISRPRRRWISQVP